MTDASSDGIQGRCLSKEGASSAIRSENPVVPPPPDPPRLVRDFRELAQDAAQIRAQQVEQARRARLTRLIALTIAISGVVLIIVGAAAVLFITHPANISNPLGDASAVHAPTEQEDVGSSSSGGDSAFSVGQADESVSAVEQVVATDQISAVFSSLAANEDGVFDGFVRAFMDDYDRGVNGEVSYGLADLGIRAEDLSQALLSGFSCTVSNVDVHGSTAWVTLELTSKSLADQADAFARSVEGTEASFEDEDAYRAFLAQAYFDAFDGVSPRSHSLLVTVEKSGSGWPVADDTIEYVLGSVWYTSA